MSDYSETFTKVDGNTIEAADFETEFQAIETASATKFDKGSTLSPNFAGGTITEIGVETPSGVATQDFTGIPSWAKKITVVMDDVSFAAGTVLQLQLGDAGGIEATNYQFNYSFLTNSAAVVVANNSGTFISFRLTSGVDASDSISGVVDIWNLTGNLWVARWGLTNVGTSHNRAITGVGTKTLSGTLTQLRVSNSSASNFDAGNINVFYEG